MRVTIHAACGRIQKHICRTDLWPTYRVSRPESIRAISGVSWAYSAHVALGYCAGVDEIAGLVACQRGAEDAIESVASACGIEIERVDDMYWHQWAGDDYASTAITPEDDA